VQPIDCVTTVERVDRRVELPVPPEEVWPALSDGRRLSDWFGADISIDARPGGRATFRWPDGRERGAVVEIADPGRRLAFRWLPFERWPTGETVVTGSGRVELELAPAGEGSVLTVSEWGSGRSGALSAGAPA
jgi:uncharacterized protein YndB with AHSA1/START domain